MLVDSTAAQCFTLGPVCSRPGNHGPPRAFPRACSSCRFRSPGRSRLALGLRVVCAGAAALGMSCPFNCFQLAPIPLRARFFLAYLCGFLWYMGNCYWVRDTMLHYGDMPPFAPTLLLIGFSLVLGLYFGLFGLGIALVRRATGSTRLALAFAPFLWTGLELAAARITSVPWDQLGYSQVDNTLINQLAPWTGVYGISFVLVAVNALLAGGLLLGSGSKNKFSGRWAWTACGALLLVSGRCGHLCPAAEARSHCHRRPHPAQSRCRCTITTGRARCGTAISPNSLAWPTSSARPTLPESRKPARQAAKSSARRIPLIPTLSSGRSRPRPSMNRIRSSSRLAPASRTLSKLRS